MADNGDKPKQKDLMYWLKAAGMALPIVLAILEFFNVTNIRDIFIEKFSPYNTVIVLDGSAAMTGGTLADGTSKFEVAIQALAKTKLGQQQVALRLFGGSCTQPDKNSWLAVKFGQDNMAKIVQAFEKRRDIQEDAGSENKATLTNAIVTAITGELAEETLKGTKKKLLVIAAGAECEGNAAREIRDALDEFDPNNEIKRDFQLIGLGVGENQRNIFRQIAEVTGKKALFVDDQIDLEIALYNAEVADTFLVAKENWLFEQGQDKRAVKLFTDVIAEGSGLSETPSWAYEAMRLKAEILMSKTDPHDEPQAIQLFGESAKGGNPEARSSLASLILSGKIAKTQFPKTLVWLTEAAQSGNPRAMYLLGRAFDEHTAWLENFKSAQMWYTTAAEAFERASTRTKNSAQKAKYEFGQEKAMKAANRVKKRIDDQTITQNN